MPDTRLPLWRAWIRWAGFFALVMAVGLLGVARRASRRALRRTRRPVSHSLYKASHVVNPDSRPAADLPERAAAKWWARCFRMGQDGYQEAPID